MVTKSNKVHSSKGSRAKQRMKPEVWVALIGGFATVTVALFNFPPFVALFQQNPISTVALYLTETPIPATATEIIESTATESNAPFSTPTATQLPTILATATDTTDSIITVAPTATPNVIDVQLIANRTSGKSPLSVDFDARGSFLREPNGNTLNCGVCNYTWYVYQNSNLINEPARSSSGTFGYRFGAKGEYRVVVRVCRGQGDSNCGFGAETISVSK